MYRVCIYKYNFHSIVYIIYINNIIHTHMPYKMEYYSVIKNDELFPFAVI